MRYRIGTALLALAAIFVFTLGGTASAGHSHAIAPWTTIGSDGTADDASAHLVDHVGPVVQIKPGAPLPATVVTRYNITAVDGLFEGRKVTMTARYRDNGAGARVILRLVEFDLMTGAVATIIGFNSDALPQLPDFQVQSTSVCPKEFMFPRKAYYIDATMNRLDPNGNPGLAEVMVSTSPC